MTIFFWEGLKRKVCLINWDKGSIKLLGLGVGILYGCGSRRQILHDLSFKIQKQSLYLQEVRVRSAYTLLLPNHTPWDFIVYVVGRDPSIKYTDMDVGTHYI